VIENEWSYTSSLLHAFMSWDRKNFMGFRSLVAYVRRLRIIEQKLRDFCLKQRNYN
jgi:hypothetical protein